MRRRTVIKGAVTLSLLAPLGCQPVPPALRVYLLDQSIPLQLIKAFRVKAAEPIAFVTQASVADLFAQLRVWDSNEVSSADTDSPTSRADWLTLTDSWLSPAISENLLQPLSPESWPGWRELPVIWRELVLRDRNGRFAADNRSIWGIPYRWASLMMIYNPRIWPDDSPPSSWHDLTRSILSRRIALPGHPRLVTGLALKALGGSANPQDTTMFDDLKDFLGVLHRQALFYSSEHYLESLILENIDLAVGWSTDILPMLQKYRKFRGALPTEGTLLSADLWVRPKDAPPVDALSQQWINYCLEIATATQLSIYSQGASPLFWGKADLPESLAQQPLLMLPPEIEQTSDFVRPLTPAVANRIQTLWRTLAETSTVH